MKIYFNGYPNHWLSPYTFLEKIIFWKKEIEYDDPVIEKWAKRIEPLCKVLQKVRKTINPEIRYVKIDRYDTWSMDHTLAPIHHLNLNNSTNSYSSLPPLHHTCS